MRKINEMTNYSVQDHIEAIKFFLSLSLSDIRKRQDIADQEMGKAYKHRNDRAAKKIQMKMDTLYAAVDIKEFGDTSIEDWAESLYNDYKGMKEQTELSEGDDWIYLKFFLDELTEANHHTVREVIEGMLYAGNSTTRAEQAFAKWVKLTRQGYL